MKDWLLRRALKRVRKALREDESWYYAFQSNIAMSFMDSLPKHILRKKNTGYQVWHEIANTAAKRFLDIWIK